MVRMGKGMVMRDVSHNTRTFRRRKAGGPASAGRSARSGKAHKHVQVPEWATESWKHRVEAEARKRLKHRVRDLGTDRR